MNTSQSDPTVEKKSYRVLVLVIIGLLALSSAMKELNQLRSFTLQAGELIASWSDSMLPTASASGHAVAESCAEKVAVQEGRNSDDFHWNGVIAPGLSIEVKGLNGEIVAEPASGAEVQVVAEKRSRKTDVSLVQMKVVQHAGGVTICALYPNEDGEYPTDCGASENGDGQNRKRSGNTRNNDVRVDFKVKVPQGVGFIGRTVNGQISATSLTGNVITNTVNGSIKISTTGYGEASTVNGGISARLGSANWPKALSFKTVNGEINLELPASVSATVDAQTLNGGIQSDFPLNMTNLEGKKHIKGTIGGGGRDLVLKTLNGSINLKIVG